MQHLSGNPAFLFNVSPRFGGGLEASWDNQRVWVGYNDLEGFVDKGFGFGPQGDRALPDQAVMNLQENFNVR